MFFQLPDLLQAVVQLLSSCVLLTEANFLCQRDQGCNPVSRCCGTVVLPYSKETKTQERGLWHTMDFLWNVNHHKHIITLFIIERMSLTEHSWWYTTRRAFVCFPEHVKFGTSFREVTSILLSYCSRLLFCSMYFYDHVSGMPLGLYLFRRMCSSLT